MKVLMLTPYLPFPLLTGGQTRSYNLIKRLSSLKHKITLFCLVKNDEERKYAPELEKFCEDVQVFTRSEKPWTLVNILRTGSSFYPFLVIRNWAQGEKVAITNKLKKERFDLIHAETFYVMPHIPATEVPILLVEQTIEYLVYRHFADESKLLLLKPLLYIDVVKMKYWELKYWRQAKKVVAMSDEDKKTMTSEVSDLNVDIVPNGVDNDYFSRKVALKSKDPIILYLGNFTWLQNREAVWVLINKIWPIIETELPQAQLWIIGKEAKSFFLRLASHKIRVDEVEDVREVYQKSTVLVAPIYGSGGTRYKNFEAFASGLPVVTTSIGIGGTQAKDGVHVVIRDEPKDIAQAAVDLITNPTFYNKVANNAKKLVAEKYDWDTIAKKLSDIYEKLGRR